MPCSLCPEASPISSALGGTAHADPQLLTVVPQSLKAVRDRMLVSRHPLPSLNRLELSSPERGFYYCPFEREKGSWVHFRTCFPLEVPKAEPIVPLKVTLAGLMTIPSRMASVEFQVQSVRPRRGLPPKSVTNGISGRPH